MNRIVLVGRLVKDPDTKITEENAKVITRIILAVDRPFKNSNGERDVDFIPVILWGKKAEVVSQYLTKGRMISLAGRLQIRKYQDKEGKDRYLTEVVADEFQFLDSKKNEEITG